MKHDTVDDTRLSDDKLKMLNAAYMKLKAIKNQQTEHIAIVGMSCRFPHADNIDSFWQLLQGNVDAISNVSKDRYDIDSYYFGKGSSKNKISSPYSGGINNIFDFDAGFFDISPKEALALDPQQRLLLEVSVEALEQANIPIDSLSQINSSVYVGISSFDYGARLQQHEETIDSYLGTGTLLSPAAGRISYTLNLKGPSMVIDTACSSSLVAIHQAMQSLRNHESDLSLVGGVGLLLEPNLSICFTKAQMLSPDGRCKTFDAEANGYVRGEGCAVVVLKRLSDAIANNDNVLAVICGSAVNQDGASGGLTIPSGPSQENVIKKALQNAEIDPKNIDYIEAHGTGTPLGDPIEVNAIGSVFANRESNLKIGSVKTNIGHLEAVSGLASLIKVVLSLQNELIPASLHFQKPNQNIAWDDLKVKVVDQNTPWLKSDTKRIAGISAFGFSGTNAHIIVAESPIAPQVISAYETKNVDGDKKEEMEKRYVFTVSAKGNVPLINNCKKFERFLKEAFKPELLEQDGDALERAHILLENICFTSNVGRTHYKDRLALVVKKPAELMQKLALSIYHIKENTSLHTINEKRERSVFSGLTDGIYLSDSNACEHDLKFAFIFQHADSLHSQTYKGIYQLFHVHAYFNAVFEECRRVSIQQGWMDEQIWDSFFTQKKRANSTHLIGLPEQYVFAFSVQYALAKFLTYLHVKPKMVIGHGVGEYVAACVAEILTLENALLLAYQCGILLQKQKKESAPGKEEVGQFKKIIQHITLKKIMRVQFFSALSNTYKPNDEEYWINHFTQLMNLTEAYPYADDITLLARIIKDDDAYVCGISMGDNVCVPNTCIEAYSVLFKKVFPVIDISAQSRECDSLLEGKMGYHFLPHMMAFLYAHGFNLRLDKFYSANPKRRKVNIPTYAWNRETYMLNTKQNLQNSYKNESDALYSLVQLSTENSTDQTIVLERVITFDTFSYLPDHQVFGKVVFPESTFIEMLFEGGDIVRKRFGSSDNFTIEDTTLHQPYIFDKDQTFIRMQLVFTRLSENSYKAEIVSLTEIPIDLVETLPNEELAKNRLLHVSGTFKMVNDHVDLHTEQSTLSSVLESFNRHQGSHAMREHPMLENDLEIDITSFYHAFSETGVQYGPHFRTVKHAVTSAAGDQILGLLEKPDLDHSSAHNFCIDPVIMDGCLQLISAIQGEVDTVSTSYFIMSVHSLRYYAPLNNKSNVWCHIVKLPNTSNAFPTFNLMLWDEEGTLLAHINSLQIRRAHKDTFLSNQSHNWFYNIAWQESSITQTRVDTFYDAEIMRTPGKWLIVSTDKALSNKIKNVLKQNKQTFITIAAGEPTDEQTEANYNIDLISHNNVETLLKDLQKALNDASPLASNRVIKGIIYTCNTDHTAIVNGSTVLCLGLLHLVQAVMKLIDATLNQSAANTTPRLCVITKNAQYVRHDDVVFNPHQGSLWGMGRVLALESPDLKPLFIDYDHLSNDLEDAMISDIIFTHHENQLAYRNGQRYEARLQNDHSVPRVASCSIDPNYSYLVTGGFGSLGKQVAQRLVDRGARYLILVSRSGATTKEAKEFVQTLEDKGVTVQSLALDISKDDMNKDDISRLITLSVPLRGVVHTAGVLEDKLVANQTEQSFLTVLAPKIQGTWNLHQLTKNIPLDFFVCFSSMTSVIGAIGQINYAAANAFMDTFCHYRTAMGLPALSISWGPWADAGMAANIELEKHWASIGMNSLELEEGMNIFERMLGLRSGHLGVMPMDWEKYPDQSHFFERLKHIKREKGAHQVKSTLLQELRSVEPTQRKKMILKYIETQVCIILGYKEGRSFEENQGFFELGMNSLTSVEFKNNLQESLSCKLSSTLTFDYPTITKLVNYLESEIIQTHEDHTEESQKSPPDRPIKETIQETVDENDPEGMLLKLSQQLGL